MAKSPRTILQNTDKIARAEVVVGFVAHLAVPGEAVQLAGGQFRRRAAPHQRAAATPFVCEQIEREGVFPGVDVRQSDRAIDDRPHHFLAGRISQSVHDAVMAVASLAAQCQ